MKQFVREKKGKKKLQSLHKEARALSGAHYIRNMCTRTQS